MSLEDDRTAATIGFVATSGALGLAAATWALSSHGEAGVLLATLALTASTLASAGAISLRMAVRDPAPS